MPVSTTPIPSVATTDSYGEWLVSANLSYSRIYDVSVLANLIETQQGSLPTLLTTDKSSIVNAINELWTQFTSGTLLQSYVGTLANLTTTNKTNIVAAINELDNDVGNLANLNTTDKSSVVNAINELVTKVLNVGDLSLLNTVDKSSLVAAINELLTGMGAVGTLSTTANDLTGGINELDAGQGDLSTLLTTNKTSLVNAINEVFTSLAGYLKLDGTNSPSADIPWGSKKITNLANGVALTDAVTVGQVPAVAGVGSLASLLTTDKTNVVSAINELFNTTVKKTDPTNDQAAQMPSGTTAERPVVPANGMIRYNEDTNLFEGYYAGSWQTINGGVYSVEDNTLSAPAATLGLNGETAIVSNSTGDDGFIYVKRAGAWTKNTRFGRPNMTVAGVAPASPVIEDYWVDTASGNIKQWLNDGVSNKWITISPISGAPVLTNGASFPASPNLMDIHVDTSAPSTVKPAFMRVDDGGGAYWDRITGPIHFSQSGTPVYALLDSSDTWYDTVDGVVYELFNDGTNLIWVQTN